MQFTPVLGNYFWSNGYAWGTCRISGDEVSLTVLKGKLGIEHLSVGDVTVKIKKKLIAAGASETIKL